MASQFQPLDTPCLPRGDCPSPTSTELVVKNPNEVTIGDYQVPKLLGPDNYEEWLLCLEHATTTHDPRLWGMLNGKFDRPNFKASTLYDTSQGGLIPSVNASERLKDCLGELKAMSGEIDSLILGARDTWDALNNKARDILISTLNTKAIPDAILRYLYSEDANTCLRWIKAEIDPNGYGESFRAWKTWQGIRWKTRETPEKFLQRFRYAKTYFENVTGEWIPEELELRQFLLAIRHQRIFFQHELEIFDQTGDVQGVYNAFIRKYAGHPNTPQQLM